jgi:hypothetical protein
MRVIAGLKWSGLILAALTSAPAFAQSANFDSLTLAPGFADSAGVVQGFTSGSVPLSSIANRDQAGNLCLGFADSTPDHILVLQDDFAQLNLQVNSGGGDTTLLIQGAGDTVYCGDDSDNSTDASIQAVDLQAGEYRIWVGSFDANVRYDYMLSIRD